jgi:hypothetical protein
MPEDDELDFYELINRESIEIQSAVSSGAEEIRKEIKYAAVWQEPTANSTLWSST